MVGWWTRLLTIWVHLERKSAPFSLRSALCSQILPLSRLSSYPLVNTSLKIWNQIGKHFGLKGPSVLTSVYRNDNFLPSGIDPEFHLWSKNGLKSIGDLYSNNIFSSFTQLVTKYSLPNHHLFHFFQIWDYVKKMISSIPKPPSGNPGREPSDYGCHSQRMHFGA